VTDLPALPDINFTELLTQLFTKVYYGHTIGEVFALSLALEQAVDSVATARLADPAPWANRLFARVWRRVPQDEKGAILHEVLNQSGRTPSESKATCKAVRAVWNLRNTLAHSALSAPAVGMEALRFDGYHKGEFTVKELTPEIVTSTLADGHAALQDLLRIFAASEQK
jgi:hypothetical protein